MNDTVVPLETKGLVVLTAEIISAYVSNHVVPHGELPDLIASVHTSLVKTAEVAETSEEKPEPKRPAVAVKKSVSEEQITCLSCGKGFKSLKRHLSTHHGVSPEEYKAEWALPSDYPMVAPAYAEKRSALAKESGLGQTRRKTTSQRKAA